MADVYRVRTRVGDIEIEVESSSKRFIDRKLAALREELTAKKAAPKKKAKATTTKKATTKKAAKKTTARRKTKASKKKPAAKPAASSERLTAAQLVSAIKKDSRHAAIKKNILDRSGQLPRILLCYYFAGQAGQSLAASDVEAMTEALGARIAATNVAKVIRQRAKQYLNADTSGAVNIHSIGKKGESAVETLIDGGKL